MVATKSGLAVPARSDAVRIVPLHRRDETGISSTRTSAGASQGLTYHGGHLLGAAQVFTIFWGEAWTSGTTKELAAEVDAFFDAILTSALIDQLDEYAVAGQPIGHGSRAGTATITAPALNGSITDGAIQHFLQGEIATNHAVPPPTADTLYFVYLPPGISVAQGGARSCQAFCGYHNDIAGRIYYAVMPYPDCGGCTGGLDILDALTATTSHELCEAITDPVPGQGWYDDAGNAEIGDLCAWQTKQVAGATVQLEWSNRANGCV